MNDGVYNQDFLNAQPAVEETKFLRHVRFEKPMVVKMDGKKKLGVVLMPGIDWFFKRNKNGNYSVDIQLVTVLPKKRAWILMETCSFFYKRYTVLLFF